MYGKKETWQRDRRGRTHIAPALQYADFVCPDTERDWQKEHISVKQSASPWGGKDIENETGESTKPAGISHAAFQISADMQSINIQLECVMFCYYIFVRLWLQSITVLLLLAASSGSRGLQSGCVPTHHSTNTNGDSRKLKLHTSMRPENKAHHISCPSIFFFHRPLSF